MFHVTRYVFYARVGTTKKLFDLASLTFGTARTIADMVRTLRNFFHVSLRQFRVGLCECWVAARRGCVI